LLTDFAVRRLRAQPVAVEMHSVDGTLSAALRDMLRSMAGRTTDRRDRGRLSLSGKWTEG
jgi:hypothetical protein